MNVSETILAFPGLDEGSNHLEKILIDRAVDGAVNYTTDLMTTVNLCAADLYASIGGLPDFSENKLTVKYPRAWYTKRAKELYRANGEPEKALALVRSKVPRGKASRSW